MSDKRVNVTAKIKPDLRKELKKRLLEDNLTYQDWWENKIKEYVDWEELQE